MDISKLQSNLDFIKSLYLNKEWNDEDCKNEILEAIEECNQKIEKAFGESMQKLWKHKPSFEAVEKVAKKFPSTLAYEIYRRIPIQVAAMHKYEYVPTLAKVGMKHNLAGENARGGLLKVDSRERRGWNTLQWFVRVGISKDADDAKGVNVMEELRRSGLLVKKDIREYNLLEHSCFKASNEEFEYLVSWDPDALIESRFQNKPLIHAMANGVKSLHLLLKAGFKYHPQIGGLLFVKDDDGTTAFEKICNEIGQTKTMDILHDILAPTRDFPILHHVFTKAPQHQKLFIDKFPWAYHLKDHNGRALHQAVLAAGAKVMNECGFLFASLSDNQIQEKDPISTLHPFAAMAVDEHADLEKCYDLLRRKPSVLEKRSRIEDISKRKRVTLNVTGLELVMSHLNQGKNETANYANENATKEEWECEVCTYLNPSRSKKCKMCKTPLELQANNGENTMSFQAKTRIEDISKRKRVKLDVSGMTFVRSHLNQVKNETANHADENATNKVWECEVCTYLNPSRSKKCKMCKAPQELFANSDEKTKSNDANEDDTNRE